MAEQQAGPIGNEYLEELKTEELEELLRGTVELPEEKRDRYICAITKELERREGKDPDGRLGDVERAWEEFRTHYQTPEGEEVLLYPEEETPNAGAARRRRLNWRRIAIVAAVIAGLMIAVPPAFGYQNIFVMMGRWNDELFHFNIPGKEPEFTDTFSGDEYSNLQEVLEEDGVVMKVVPTVIPEGFELQDIYAKEYPGTGKKDYDALYQNKDGQSISFYVVRRDKPSTRNYEKDGTPIEEYEKNDITHFIFENNDRLYSTWYIDDLECSIQTDLPINELKSMIDSIYE